jgi:hypothetical protein
MDDSVLCSNLLKLMPNATLYHFGILTSNVHMAWMQAVAGRLKSDYRYSTGSYRGAVRVVSAGGFLLLCLKMLG